MRKRATLTLDIWAVAWLSLFAIARCQATAPNEDFGKWYKEWSNSVSQDFDTTFTQFFGHDKNSPLVMTITNWTEGKYRLCTVANSVIRKNRRLLVNPSYAASIEAKADNALPWILLKYASRSDTPFEELATNFGNDPYFLGPATVFDADHRQKVSPAIDRGKAQGQVEITFPKTDKSQPRDPQTISATLDGANGWMPTEVKVNEFGGIHSRKKIDGWHPENGIWVYSAVATFVRLPDSQAEVDHSIEKWNFTPSDPDKDHRAECYLHFYGLPEPAGSDTWSRALVFAVGIILLLVGYALIKRRHVQAS